MSLMMTAMYVIKRFERTIQGDVARERRRGGITKLSELLIWAAQHILVIADMKGGARSLEVVHLVR